MTPGFNCVPSTVVATETGRSGFGGIISSMRNAILVLLAALLWASCAHSRASSSIVWRSPYSQAQIGCQDFSEASIICKPGWTAECACGPSGASCLCRIPQLVPGEEK